MPSISTAPTITAPRGSVPFTNNPAAMTIITTMFFMWGFITALNDILIPHLKHLFTLTYFEVMTVQFCFFSAYFVFALPFSKLVEKAGYQKTMVTGLCTSAVGALMFVPAAIFVSFPLFLAALIVVAAGLTALQVSANPYVSLLGNALTASSRLNLSQAINSLGTTIAPIIGGALLLKVKTKEVYSIVKVVKNNIVKYVPTWTNVKIYGSNAHEAHIVILPYVVIALVLLLIAGYIAISKLPVMADTAGARSQEHKGKHSILTHRQTILGALAIFVYVGAEVSIGSFLVNYFELGSIGGLRDDKAADMVAFYWGGAMVGRFIGSAVLRSVKPNKALAAVAAAAALLVITSMLTSHNLAMYSILAVGLFNSVMFPNIFTLGIADLGPLTGEGSGLLIAAIVGGAIIPLAQGFIADKIGVHHAFILPIICYGYIIYYGLVGSKPVKFVEDPAVA